MPQPTTNSWPLKMKEPPSADGHIGAVVAGAGAAEDEVGADKLADAEVISELPLGLDDDGVPAIEAAVLVSVDDIWSEESGKMEASAELVGELESAVVEVGKTIGGTGINVVLLTKVEVLVLEDEI